jgi:hypothetical protein
MSKPVHKDGKIMGCIETGTDGKQVTKDTRHRIRGEYDPKTNQARDYSYKVVCQGNLLVAMLTAPY